MIYFAFENTGETCHVLLLSYTVSKRCVCWKKSFMVKSEDDTPIHQY